MRVTGIGRRARAAMAGIAAALLAGPGEVSAAPEIRRVSDGARLEGVAALAEVARAHDLVVMGEIHDNPAHQRMQAALARAARVPAMAFEMAPRAREAALRELRAAQRAGEASDALREAAAWADYAPYHGVMAAAPRAAVAAAGLPREALRRAMTDGAAAAFAGDPARWGLDTAPPAPVRADMEAELRASHCGLLPEAMIPGMVEAQRLRDAEFAAALLRARAAAPPEAGDGPALLVTGNGHARRDRGTPAFLRVAAPELSVLSIGQIERREDDAGWRDALARWTPEGADPLFEIVVITDAAPREDPCEALRRRMEGAPAANGD